MSSARKKITDMAVGGLTEVEFIPGARWDRNPTARLAPLPINSLLRSYRELRSSQWGKSSFTSVNAISLTCKS
jgi:hypothetical protein